MKELKFYFGEDGTGKFNPYEPGSTMITGVTGSGKSSFIMNLIRQIIINYDSDDVNLEIFDGNNILFGSEGISKIKKCSVIKSVSNNYSDTFSSFIGELYRTACERIAMVEYSKHTEKELNWKSLVAVVDEPSHLINSLSYEDMKNIYAKLEYMCKNARKTKVYIIFTMSNSIRNIERDIWLGAFDYIVSTRSSREDSYVLAGNDALSDLPKYGKAGIKIGPDITIIVVPFYSDRVIRDIVSGETLPKGVKFSTKQLEQLSFTI